MKKLLISLSLITSLFVTIAMPIQAAASVGEDISSSDVSITAAAQSNSPSSYEKSIINVFNIPYPEIPKSIEYDEMTNHIYYSGTLYQDDINYVNGAYYITFTGTLYSRL